MNTLVSPMCAKRALIRLVAIVSAVAGIFLMAGCGSSSSRITPLGGHFSRASLKGQYVIAQTGTGINNNGVSQSFSETIVFTADGAGNLNVTLDDFSQGNQFHTISSAQAGTYAISSDGTGSITVGGLSLAITMIDDNHFYVMEQDSGGTSSGYGELQDTTAFTAPPAGKFVFKSHNLNISSRVGGFTITAGAISGTEDFLNLGTTAASASIISSAAMTTPDSNGSGSFTLTDGTSFYYYVVNSNKFHFMANNGTLEIGTAEAQSGTFSLATLAPGTSYVFGSSGDTSVSGSGGIHSAGVFTSDGAGGITTGTVDFVQDTTANPDLTVSGGAYTLAANGRGTLDLTLSGGAISPQIFWMVNSSRAYFLVDSALAAEDGDYTLQTGTTITSQAAFSMDGFDTGGFKDRLGVFSP
jgi:hypothetical protein